MSKDFGFEVFFDNLVTKGRVEKEKEITEGFTIKLKALDSKELLAAENVSIASNPNAPYDVILKVRVLSTLTRAIVEINGVPIDAMDDNETKKRREALYEKLTELPGYLIDQCYLLYLEAVDEQINLFKDPIKITGDVENF